jgi:radical SAM protein with 4Fe4S-binding SPASM domain
MIEWMKENDIGMQVSLDDLDNSKPLKTGKSSSEIVLKNIIKAQSNNISFSINTVLDIEKTASLTPIVNYVSSFKNKQWGLSASFTMSDDRNIEKIINVLKEGIDTLRRNRFDIYNNLRFYNMIPIFTGSGRCGAGIDTVAIGTDLEVWACQSQCDKKPLGFYNENIDRLLKESKENEYFYKKMVLPECADCSIFDNCRGGCRVTHNDPQINKVTCHIRREIMTYILKTVPMFTNYQKCEHDKEAMEGVYSLIDGYVSCLDEKDKKFVETPSLEESWN